VCRTSGAGDVRDSPLQYLEIDRQSLRSAITCDQGDKFRLRGFALSSRVGSSMCLFQLVRRRVAKDWGDASTERPRRERTRGARRPQVDASNFPRLV